MTMTPRQRIRELRWLPAKELKADERNWRKHPKAQRDALKAMLVQVGMADALIGRDTPDGVVLVDGHLRADMLDGDVPVLIVDLDEAEAGQVLATLDPIAGMAQANMDALRALTAVQPTMAEMVPLLATANDYNAEAIGRGGNGTATVNTSLDNTDTVQGTAKDEVGYDMTSVWPRDGDAAAPFSRYAMSLPKTATGAYSRSPFGEMLRIVQTYMRPGDRFLEICAGWSTFSMTAILAGYSGIGVDIWDVSLRFAAAQLQALPYDVQDRYSVVEGDALALPFGDNEFDYAYCNPPFADLETYSEADNAIEGAANHEEWLGLCAGLFAEARRVLKPGALLTTVMADSRKDGVLQQMHADWTRVGQEAGFDLHDIVVQHLISQQARLWRQAHNARRTAKAHEYVITFRAP